MAATVVTLNDLERYSSVAGLFKCNPSNICASFYGISTDSVLARFLCISRASCHLPLVPDGVGASPKGGGGGGAGSVVGLVAVTLFRVISVDN